MSTKDVKTNFLAALTELDKRVQAIKLSQLNDVTPNSGWSVRDLLNHVAGEQLWIPETLGGKTIAEVGSRLDGDVLGAQPLITWSKAAKKAREAVQAVDIDIKVSLSAGRLPASQYLQEMTIDSFIHSWDLARAIGASEVYPDELSKVVYDLLVPIAEEWRKYGAFGPKIDVAGDSPTLVKILALSGRQA